MMQKLAIPLIVAQQPHAPIGTSEGQGIGDLFQAITSVAAAASAGPPESWPGATTSVTCCATASIRPFPQLRVERHHALCCHAGPKVLMRP